MGVRDPHRLYPYRVLASDLTADEIQDLCEHLFANARAILEESSNALVEVLLPVTKINGKSLLDVLVDRVKEWLATRSEDQKVLVYGPDNEVVLIQKTGDELRTSSQKGSNDLRR